MTNDNDEDDREFTMINRTLNSVLMISIAAAVGIVADTEPAQALSVPGLAGKATFSGDTSCFVPDFQAVDGALVRNTCSTARKYDIPLAVNQGSHLVTIAVGNQFQGAVTTCTLYGFSQFGLASSQQSGSAVNGTLQLTATVPSFGYLNLRCNIAAGSQINGVNYGQ
jgi:hypothetical protein